MMRIAKVIVLVAVVAALAWSQTPAAKKERPVARKGPLTEQWVSLFNGKDLTGWVPVGNEKWVVQDGAIYGEGVTKEYGYLATDRDYKDFHLSLRFKCEADGN